MEDKLQSAYELAYSKTKEDYKKAEEAYYRRPLKEQTGFMFDFARNSRKLLLKYSEN